MTATASQPSVAAVATTFALASYSSPAPTLGSSVRVVADAPATTPTAALAEADAAITAASTVTADIAASGLDIGAPAVVDTTELEAAAETLEDLADTLPAPLLPALTEKVTAQVASVDADVSGLRGSLDAAVALKAEQEAAAKAAAEAEAAAAAAEAAAAEAAAAEANAAETPAASSGSSPASPPPVYLSGGSVGDNSPAGAQATARSMLGGYGWGDDQFGCLVSLWNKESGWNYQAYNRSSGATGIPQALPGSKMASAGADWQTNAATQIAWGFGYISGRYGTPCNAWGHSQSVGWY